MKEFKECKILCGKSEASYFNDIIYLPIHPALLSDLTLIFQKKALDAESYSLQGADREVKDYFQDVLNYWRKMRYEIDELKKREKK